MNNNESEQQAPNKKIKHRILSSEGYKSNLIISYLNEKANKKIKIKFE